MRKSLFESQEGLDGFQRVVSIMKRRSVLATSAGIVFSSVAGCLGGAQTAPEGMDVETRHWVADILEEGIWYQRREREESVDRYHELIDDETTAQNRIDGGEEVRAFVEETDFAESYLVVVQNMMQSARWLELQQIERTTQGLDIAVETASPDEPYGDDAAVHSLAIRVTDEQAGTPDELQVTIDGEPTET